MTKIILAFFILFSFLSAQEPSKIDELKKKIDEVTPGQSRFLLRGYAHSGFESYDNRSSFVGGSFNPIFLWQQSDRLLFEAELEIELEDGKTEIALEYANMAYILNQYLTLRLGKFILPYGIFAERLHPRWINRLPSNPLGFGHDSVGPARDLGIELRGGMPVGNSKINYAIYVTNGPKLNDGSDPDLELEEIGMLVYDIQDDNNENKALGGRIGFLPFSNSSLEVGFSGQYAKVGNTDSKYEDIAALLYAADFSYISNFEILKGVVDIKGQLNGVNVDKAKYFSEEDSSFYSFDNESQSYFAQLSFRPAYVSSSFIQSLELVGRYSALTFPEGSLWENEETQWTFGVNYWLDWRTVLKVAYQITDAGGHGHEGESENAILVHWSFGF